MKEGGGKEGKGIGEKQAHASWKGSQHIFSGRYGLHT